MNLWSVMAAPLEIGSNILNLSAYDLETYTNAEVIEIDQDPRTHALRVSIFFLSPLVDRISS